MIDQQIIDLILEWISNYGVWILGLYMIFAASALPLPATPTLVITGALARQGLFNWYAAFISALIGILIADLISYALGRFAGDWVDRHIGNRFGDSWFNAQTQFKRYGGWAIFLSRSLLASLDVPINMFAGASRYDIKKFILIDLLGTIFYISIFGGSGYAVSSQYELIIQTVQRFAGWLGIIAVAGLVIYLLIRRRLQNNAQETAASLNTIDRSDSAD
jgi:membrane protein DedA with SNARE-associated domain